MWVRDWFIENTSCWSFFWNKNAQTNEKVAVESLLVNTLRSILRVEQTDYLQKTYNRHLTDLLWLILHDCVPTDRYQAVGRKVHMDYVQEQLKTEKKVNLGDSQERPNDIDIEILADTVYVKVSQKKQTNIKGSRTRNSITATWKESENKTEQKNNKQRQ